MIHCEMYFQKIFYSVRFIRLCFQKCALSGGQLRRLAETLMVFKNKNNSSIKSNIERTLLTVVMRTSRKALSERAIRSISHLSIVATCPLRDKVNSFAYDLRKRPK